MSVVSNELDYQKKVLTHPLYSLTKLTPIQGSQAVVVSSGGNELIFECPPNQSWNPSKSYFSFTLNPAASGVGRFNWLWGDVMAAIQSLQVQTKGGLQLMNLNNYDVYHKGVLKAITKLEDYLENDSHCFFQQFGVNCGLNRSNALVNADANIVNPPNARRSTGSGERYPETAGTENSAQINYTEFCYVIGGGSDNTADPIVNFRLPFSLLKEHFLGLDKDVLFNETIQIKIVFNPVSKIGYSGTSATAPSTGAAAIVSANYTVSNALVYLAMEQDKEINNLVLQKVNSAEGLKLLIPYVYPVKINLASGADTIHSWSQRFNRNNGSHLLRIHHILTPSTEAALTTYQTTNINAVKLTDFYYSLNNNRIQQFNISSTSSNPEDYLCMMDLIRGSTLQSSDIYSYNWIFTQCFAQQTNPLDYQISEQNHIEGLPLDVEQKIDFFGTCKLANGLNHYTYAVCLKELMISSTGIQLM